MLFTGWGILSFPYGNSWLRKLSWTFVLPIRTVFLFTIPDCEHPRFKTWFPITFLMCIVWIGGLSYVVAWMITVVGKQITYLGWNGLVLNKCTLCKYKRIFGLALSYFHLLPQTVLTCLNYKKNFFLSWL